MAVPGNSPDNVMGQIEKPCLFSEKPCDLDCKSECVRLKAAADAMSERHDFQQIIADLERAGWTVHKIATRLKRQFIQIQRIKEGGRVTYPIDFELIALHAECSTGNITIVPSGQAMRMRMT